MFFARVRWIGRVLDGAGIDTYSKTGRELTSTFVELSKCYQEKNRRGDGASGIRLAIGPSGWALVAAMLAPVDSRVTEHLSEALGLSEDDTSTLLERVQKVALELAKQEIPDTLASMTDGKPLV